MEQMTCQEVPSRVCAVLENTPDTSIIYQPRNGQHPTMPPGRHVSTRVYGQCSYKRPAGRF